MVVSRLVRKRQKKELIEAVILEGKLILDLWCNEWIIEFDHLQDSKKRRITQDLSTHKG